MWRLIVSTRFAPSPTGYLHLGGLRTALISYLYSRTNGMRFRLRIEDTDRKRLVPDAEDDFVSCLNWVGIHYHNSSRQSHNHERGHYTGRVDNIPHYYAYDTPEELATMRKLLEEQKNPDRSYDRTLGKNQFTLSKKERMERMDYQVVRFDKESYSRNYGDLGKLLKSRKFDIGRDVTFTNDQLDDFILIKSDGWPTYHLASVVDDLQYETRVVFRGEEWLSSLPKHVALMNCLGRVITHNNFPYTFYHLPLIMNSDGTKMSKRKIVAGNDVPVHVRNYKEIGFDPFVLCHYLLSTIMKVTPIEQCEGTMEELEKMFGQMNIETGLSKSPSQFNYQHLLSNQSAFLSKKLLEPYKMFQVKNTLKHKLPTTITINRNSMEQIIKEATQRNTFESEIVDFLIRQLDSINKYTNLKLSSDEVDTLKSIPLTTILKSELFTERKKNIENYLNNIEDKKQRRKVNGVLRKVFMNDISGVPVDIVLGYHDNNIIFQKTEKVLS